MGALASLSAVYLTVENFTLRHIDLELYKSEVHILMGENGSGKSLLMDVLRGAKEPSSGEITFNFDASNTLYAGDILYIHQDDGLLDNLSVAENLFFHQMPYKHNFLKIIDYDQLDYKFRKIIKDLNLPIAYEDKLSSLGLAQRQIINICKAYLSDAKIIILDEPSGSLGHNEKELLYSIIEKIKERGAGIFFITHRLEDVMRIGDRITVLRKGAIAGTKVVSESTEKEIIELLAASTFLEKYPKLNIHKGKKVLEVEKISCLNKLEDVSFSVRQGEILGVTGFAGSGRSLLAHCLFGETGYTGDIRIDGQSVHLDSPATAIKNGIAMVPENQYESSVFTTLNADENIALPSMNRFSTNFLINNDFLSQTVLDYLQKLNMSDHYADEITDFNSSDLQKAIFAKWMMNRAKIFILDEPTKGIDIASKIDIYNFINDLLRKKVAVVYISSDIEEIFGICDRVAVLSNNTLIGNYDVNDTSVEEIMALATATD